MTRWHIEPGGVQDVLTKVGNVAGLLSNVVQAMPGKAEAAVTAGNSPIIGDAIAGFFEHHKPTLEGIGNRINASLGGAAAATRWYLEGDETMAAQQQSAAATCTGPRGRRTMEPPPSSALPTLRQSSPAGINAVLRTRSPSMLHTPIASSRS